MAKNRNRHGRKEDFAMSLKTETWQAIIGIGCLAFAAFFLLARFHLAGVVGNVAYRWLEYLVGFSFILLPAVLIILSLSFFKSERPNFVIGRLVGGLILFLATLGLIQILFKNQSGGAIGQALTGPLVSLFDVYFSVILLAAIAGIALLTTLDIGRLWPTTSPFAWFKRKQTEAELNKSLEIDEVTVSLEEKNESVAEAASATETPVKTKAAEAVEDSFLPRFGQLKRRGQPSAFTPPPLSLLEDDSGKPNAGDIKASANIIKRTLGNFGIQVEMDEVSIGPSITRYAFKPAEGVKLSRIVGLQNDLALALAAHPIRIEAPIPGKSLVGIEIPNSVKARVGLASLLASLEFRESPQPLLFSLGRGVTGNVQLGNLAKAPHVLIAGATGSGKSVTIHTIITSLLYRQPPDRLRFIMIDPKRVELTLYNRLPHLLTPVITDAKKAILALKWAATEMSRRYDILEKEAVRDIASYHQNILAPAEAKAAKAATEEDLPDKLPYVVIVIDELADIMSLYPRELEAAIVRLAQMSRAVGIHLILSTQRPSVEVITGLIKANIPTRIALQVASQIDSRTILDLAGAEKLLGSGDMLYLSAEMSKPVRLQSAYISEEEVKGVTKYLVDHQETEELPAIDFTATAQNGATFTADLSGETSDDELYEDAREAVIEAGKASASYLQRKLKVGYARAARLLDLLEERNVIGPGDGAKPREVYGQAPTETLTDDGEAPL